MGGIVGFAVRVLPMAAVCLIAAAAVGQSGGMTDATQRTLGRPGYLIIEAARDTATGFSWREGPAPGRRSLVWPQGFLSLPDSMMPEAFSRADLGLTCTPELSGTGASGELLFQDGIYPVSEPILLADGVFELHLSGGELEIRGGQIRYRRDALPAPTKQRANYLMLAGMVILITVLLRLARLQARGGRRP